VTVASSFFFPTLLSLFVIPTVTPDFARILISYRRIVQIYFKTLASSRYIGFHEGRRQFINKVFTRKYVETKKNYLQECMLNTGVTHTLTLGQKKYMWVSGFFL
jgi:hypothetical protein